VLEALLNIEALFEVKVVKLPESIG
jgi:hypothetical protein